MSHFDTGLIHQRYEQNGHFYYPEMKRLLDEVVDNPNKAIVIPDTFVSKSLEDGNILTNLVQRISIFFQKLFGNIKYFISSSYREKYKLAVRKIKDACVTRDAQITRLRASLLSAKTSYETAKGQLAPLQGRITVLSQEKETLSNKLQESIDAKNLIVQQARELKAIREPALNILSNEAQSFSERMEAIFTSERFRATFTPKGSEPEAIAIKESDPDFPLEDLTDESIANYDNEDFEGSSFITKLKSERVSMLTNENLLIEEQARLEATNTVASTALESIRTAIQEVGQLDLENFFDQDDLIAPESEADVNNDRELTPREIKLAALKQDIKTKSNEYLATLFSLLIGRLPEDSLSEWICDQDGNFTLKLNRMYPIWVPEKAFNGAIILIGSHQNGEIKGKLERNKIDFHSGMANYVKYGVHLEPTFLGMSFISRTDIRVGGKCVGQERWKQKNFAELKKDWSITSILVSDDYPGGYQKFLDDKALNS